MALDIAGPGMIRGPRVAAWRFRQFGQVSGRWAWPKAVGPQFILCSQTAHACRGHATPNLTGCERVYTFRARSENGETRSLQRSAADDCRTPKPYSSLGTRSVRQLPDCLLDGVRRFGCSASQPRHTAGKPRRMVGRRWCQRSWHGLADRRLPGLSTRASAGPDRCAP